MLKMDFETSGCVAMFHVGGEENERRDEKLVPCTCGAHDLSNSGSLFPGNNCTLKIVFYRRDVACARLYLPMTSYV